MNNATGGQNEPETQADHKSTLSTFPTAEPSARLFGYVLLAVVILFVAAGIYYYQIEPAISHDIPSHLPRPLDAEPLELASIPVRYSGENLSPQCVRAFNDAVYMTFKGNSIIQVYTADMELLRTMHLEHPVTTIPSSLAVTDSFVILGDSIQGTVAVFGPEGNYLASASFYPDKQNRIKPIHLSAVGGMLLVTDLNQNRVAEVSLIQHEPFYEFLELLDGYPRIQPLASFSPSCAVRTPDKNLWIADAGSNSVSVYDADGKLLRAVEPPVKNRIVFPIDMLVVYGDSSTTRVHVLDKLAGKVFVYDLSGNLRLVYPQSRSLDRPCSITADSKSRRIFVTEEGSAKITVLGY